MSRKLTTVLSVLVALAAVGVTLAGWRMAASRRAALNAGQDFAAAHSDMDDLAAWHMAGDDSGG